MFKTVYEGVFPLVEKKYDGKVQFIFRHQVQPWHPSSTMTHEAAIAVLKVAPEKFWPFSSLLMARSKEYYDVNVVKEGRNETYKRLAKLATEIGVEEKSVLDLLKVSDKPAEDGSLNTGNQITNDLKLIVRVRRLSGYLC